MINKIKRWWDWNGRDILGFFVTPIALIIAFVLGLLYLLVSGAANSYQYNCELDRKPSLYTAFWIDDSTYAYDPEGFCNKLREKMAQE